MAQLGRIFFWTPPHFWALSLLIHKQNERAGVPMLPVVRSEDETRIQIVLYSILYLFRGRRRYRARGRWAT